MIDDRMLDELTELVTEDPPALRDLAVERGLLASDTPVVDAGVVFLRSGVTAARLAELRREAEARERDRIVADLQAGRPVEFPDSARYGGYRLIRELGRGRYARVWLAWDEQIKRLAAVKILAGTNEDVVRFQREAQMGARLVHPRIAAPYAVGEAHGSHFIAMEYIDGASLEGTTLEPRVAARVVREAARVIQFAHKNGVVHRDVKPGNIMLAKGGVHLVDFGLARPFDVQLSVPGAVMGTIAYMSPEQAEGKPATPLVDVYGLGATLYRLVTGRPPVEGVSALECLERVKRLDYPPPRRVRADVPAPLEAIILKAMSEAAHRYPSAAALADDLDRWLGDKAVQANPTLPRVMRRTRRLAPAVVVVAAIAAVVIWALTRPKPSGEDAAAAARRVQEAHQHLGLARSLVEDARLNLYKKGAKFSETFFANLAKAADGARKSIALNDTQEAHYLLGRVHQLAGDYDEAIREYDRALAFGRSAPSLLGKARAYLEQAADALSAGDEPQTTWLLASARRIFEDVPGLARRLPEGGVESELTEAWRRLASDPVAAAEFARPRVAQHEEFAAVLGLAYFRRGEYGAAVRAFTDAIDRRPNYYQVFVYRAAVLEAGGQREFALAELDLALGIHPRHVPALLARAKLHDAMGNARAAAADRESAARLKR